MFLFVRLTSPMMTGMNCECEGDWNEGVELLATNAATEDIYAIGAVSTADVNLQPP